MGLIDTHAHLTDAALAADLPGVLARARTEGVEAIIAVGSDAADSAQAIELARAFAGGSGIKPAGSAGRFEQNNLLLDQGPGQHGPALRSGTADSFEEGAVRVFATAGVHPHQAGRVVEEDWARLESLLGLPEVVACGEIGLDYHYDLADRADQRAVFARQLESAAPLGKPLVIHCREALDDTVGLMTDAGWSGRPAVFHCFSSGPEEAEVIAGHGWRLSFTGLVTYKSAGPAREVARQYPAGLLMLETDSPYLAPVPLRGRFPNEPANLPHTARCLAELRGVEVGALIEQTTANARAFFGLPRELA